MRTHERTPFTLSQTQRTRDGERERGNIYLEYQAIEYMNIYREIEYVYTREREYVERERERET
jgi:hypothetical protein